MSKERNSLKLLLKQQAALERGWNILRTKTICFVMACGHVIKLNVEPESHWFAQTHANNTTLKCDVFSAIIR